MSISLEKAIINSIAPMNRVWINIFLSNELSISVEGFFRIINVSGNIELTSDDWCSNDFDEASLQTMRTLTVGATIISAAIKEIPADLALVLSNGNAIEIFTHSSFYDSWSINGNQGTILAVEQNRGVQKYN